MDRIIGGKRSIEIGFIPYHNGVRLQKIGIRPESRIINGEDLVGNPKARDNLQPVGFISYSLRG